MPVLRRAPAQARRRHHRVSRTCPGRALVRHSSTYARSSPAGPARRSPSRRRPSQGRSRRGRAGSVLLAEIATASSACIFPCIAKQPPPAFAREGVEVDVSTMADWMGAVSSVTSSRWSMSSRPMSRGGSGASMSTTRRCRNWPRAELARGPRNRSLVGWASGGKTKTGRLWTAVRDDRPFGGVDPPAAFYIYSPERGGVHPEAFLGSWSGIMQADAYAGFNRLYEPARLPGTIIEAGCWAHWRRKFYEIAGLKPRRRSPSRP